MILTFSVVVATICINISGPLIILAMIQPFFLVNAIRFLASVFLQIGVR